MLNIFIPFIIYFGVSVLSCKFTIIFRINVIIYHVSQACLDMTTNITSSSGTVSFFFPSHDISSLVRGQKTNIFPRIFGSFLLHGNFPPFSKTAIKRKFGYFWGNFISSWKQKLIYTRPDLVIHFPDLSSEFWVLSGRQRENTSNQWRDGNSAILLFINPIKKADPEWS